MKSRIGFRLVTRIVLFSSFITLIVTAIQIHADYRDDIQKIDSYLGLIRESYLESLSNSVWTYDQKQIRLQLEGLLRLPDMERLRIQSDVDAVWSAGKIESRRLIEREFPLTYRYGDKTLSIGTLELAFSLDNIYQRLIQKTLVILTGNAVRTFLVSGFILLIFHLMVTRHLTALARWLNRHDPGRTKDAFYLDRKPSPPGSEDELDEVAKAINRMQAGLESRLEDLQDSHALLRAIIEGTTDAIFLKDMEGRYLMANGAALAAIGHPKEVVIGSRDADLFSAESAAIIEENDASVMASGAARLAEEELITAYGQTWWLANKSPYRDGHGKVVGLIGISRNITDLKKAEAEKERLEVQLRQSQKLESIGTLAGGIAHDFNNILAAIIGYADMAQTEIPRENPAYRMIGQVLKAGERAKELIRHILTFSRKSEQVMEPVRLSVIVKEAMSLLRASIPMNIDIHQSINPNAGMILADPTQIHQIVVNLCANAAQAMEETGGRIDVVVENAVPPPETEDAKQDRQVATYIKLSVRDTGPGIDPAHFHNIFDPYFTTKEVGKGSGMGLAVVHGIVESHSGKIVVQNDPASGRGAVFDIYFPQARNAAETGPAPLRDAMHCVSTGGGEHILLVDDEPMLVETGKKTLSRLGYVVTAETSSVAALELFKKEPYRFDLVFTDQTMPVLTGVDLAKSMLAIRPDIPIILCTGYSNLIDETEARNLGVRALAMKPLMKQEVSALIQAALEDA